MCKWDEAFTEQEMLEETGYCKDCKMDCPNAGKTFKEEAQATPQPHPCKECNNYGCYVHRPYYGK